MLLHESCTRFMPGCTFTNVNKTFSILTYCFIERTTIWTLRAFHTLSINFLPSYLITSRYILIKLLLLLFLLVFLLIQSSTDKFLMCSLNLVNFLHIMKLLPRRTDWKWLLQQVVSLRKWILYHITRFINFYLWGENYFFLSLKIVHISNNLSLGVILFLKFSLLNYWTKFCYVIWIL